VKERKITGPRSGVRFDKGDGHSGDRVSPVDRFNRLFIVGFLLLGTVPLIWADTVIFHDGTVVGGTIVARDDQQITLKVRQAAGTITSKRYIKRADVAKILPGMSPYARVKLADGTFLDGTIVADHDKSITLEVKDATGTITSKRPIRRDEILQLTRLTDAEMLERETLTAYELARRYQLSPSNSFELAQYDRVIDEVFTSFLSRYPNTAYAMAISDLKQQWQTEREIVATGKVKVGGQWTEVRLEPQEPKVATETAQTEPEDVSPPPESVEETKTVRPQVPWVFLLIGGLAFVAIFHLISKLGSASRSRREAAARAGPRDREIGAPVESGVAEPLMENESFSPPVEPPSVDEEPVGSSMSSPEPQEDEDDLAEQASSSFEPEATVARGPEPTVARDIELSPSVEKSEPIVENVRGAVPSLPSGADPQATIAKESTHSVARAAGPSPPAEDNVPLLWNVGDVILDLYEVKKLSEDREYAEGGFGRVYRVHHKGWNIDLAVKSPREDAFETDEQKGNFERECETWINLGLHPNIVSCSMCADSVASRVSLLNSSRAAVCMTGSTTRSCTKAVPRKRWSASLMSLSSSRGVCTMAMNKDSSTRT